LSSKVLEGLGFYIFIIEKAKYEIEIKRGRKEFVVVFLFFFNILIKTIFVMREFHI